MFGAALVALTLLQTPAATKFVGLLWDYPDTHADLAVFTVCVDDLPCVTKPAADVRMERAAETPAGYSTYGVPLPALVISEHRAVIRACNVDAADVCGPDAAVAFKIVAAMPAVESPRVRK